MSTPFLTLRDVLRHAVSRFNQAGLCFGHGSATAYDEAVYLMLHTLHLPLDTLEPFLDARLTDAEIAGLMRIIEQRADDRMPAAYLTHEAWLRDYRFYIDERAIVPRSFIAELLEDGLRAWIDPDEVEAVLDLCTGSGCLAIIAADTFTGAQVDAVDISPDALAVAHRNVEEYRLGDRVALYQGDLYAPLPERRYDVILANPPYVNAASMRALPQEYRYEPALALGGGEDGMDVTRRIVAQAAPRLTRSGILVVEIGNERDHAEAAFGGLGLTWLETSAGDSAVFMLRASDLPD